MHYRQYRLGGVHRIASAAFVRLQRGLLLNARHDSRRFERDEYGNSIVIFHRKREC